MPYKLFCSDVDGTLLNNNKELSSRTRDALRALAEAGMQVTLATGRMPAALRRFGDLVPPGTLLICCNGGILTRAGSGEVLTSCAMSRESTLAALERGRAWGAALSLWQNETVWVEGSEEMIRWYEHSVGCVTRPLAEFLQENDGGCSKLLCFGLQSEVERWVRDLEEHPLPEIDSVTSDLGTLELLPKGVNKGLGLRKCAELLGVRREEILAVGDSENDLPMFSCAGFSAAMGNAREAVKRAADIVIPSNEDDGVAWLIEHRLL